MFRPSRHSTTKALIATLVLSGSVASAEEVVAAPGDTVSDPEAYEPLAGWVAPARSPGRLAPETGALMGTHSFDDHGEPPQAQGITKLEAALGRTMDIDNRYYGDFDDFVSDGLTWMEYWDIDNGRIPLVGWGCTDSGKVNSGSLDDIIRKTAQVMRDFKHEFFMRYCWEMDGSRKQGEVRGPEAFIESWRRMYTIFQEEGATNVIWVWTPNAAGFKDKRSYTKDANGEAQPPAPYFYPGDEYVDWIASDGYNWGVSKRDQGDRWRHVIEIFDEFMVFARKHPKPIMIGEYGAQEQPDDPAAKAEWMKIAHEALMDKPRTDECPWCGVYNDVAAIVYFDVDYGKHGDWRIMSSPGSQAAYEAVAGDPWFNQIHKVNWPPSTHRTNPPATPSGPPPPKPKDEASAQGDRT